MAVTVWEHRVTLCLSAAEAKTLEAALIFAAAHWQTERSNQIRIEEILRSLDS